MVTVAQRLGVGVRDGGTRGAGRAGYGAGWRALWCTGGVRVLLDRDGWRDQPRSAGTTGALETLGLGGMSVGLRRLGLPRAHAVL